MTEPAVASPTRRTSRTSIRRDGDSYVIDGRKWLDHRAMSSACKVAIVDGQSDFAAAKHKQQSMILVPMDSPGLIVERSLSVYAINIRRRPCRTGVFAGVRVPAANMLLGEGRGFEDRAGTAGAGAHPSLHAFIGLASARSEAMCRRAKARVAFGRAACGIRRVRQAIGQSRCDIEQARLVTLQAAWTMDRHGAKAARNAIAIAKIVVPETVGPHPRPPIQIHAAPDCRRFLSRRRLRGDAVPANRRRPGRCASRGLAKAKSRSRLIGGGNGEFARRRKGETPGRTLGEGDVTCCRPRRRFTPIHVDAQFAANSPVRRAHSPRSARDGDRDRPC